MTKHALKTIPPYFDDVLLGYKPFEVRRDDRGFQVGDTLLLREFDERLRAVEPETQVERLGDYTGREVERHVTYVLRDGHQFGVQPGFVVLGLSEDPDPLDHSCGDGCLEPECLPAPIPDDLTEDE